MQIDLLIFIICKINLLYLLKKIKKTISILYDIIIYCLFFILSYNKIKNIIQEVFLMKKIFSILVLISILFTSISCGGNVPDKINETNEINDKSTSTETESNEPILEIPKGSNFNDETFTMISYDPDVVNWNYVALDTDEVNGEILNDSLYNRNRKIEEELNIKLKYVTFKDVGQFPKEFIKSVSSVRASKAAWSCT